MIAPSQPDMLRLSVVVPCYDEEEVLEALCQRLDPVCAAAAGDDYEIIFVNDGSRDRTGELLRQKALADPRIAVVNLSRNHGHQLALSAGLSLARGDLVLVLDADLQDPPELLPEMMALIDGGADVVYGQRRRRDGETAFKSLTAKYFYRLIARMSSVDIPLDSGDFRLMTRRVVEALGQMPEQHRFIRGMVSWIGFNQVPLLYDREARHAGVSKYPLKKMLSFAIDALTGFSIVPLRLATMFGMIGLAAAIITLVYALAAYLLGATVTGWTSLIAVILLVSSVQFLMLGIIGEYIGRVFMQSKQRPLFLIESIYRADAAGAEEAETLPEQRTAR